MDVPRGTRAESPTKRVPIQEITSRADDLEEVRSLLATTSLPSPGKHVLFEEPRTPKMGALTPHRGRFRASMVANALSGMVAAMIAEVLLFPVDTVKLLMQTTSGKSADGFARVFLQVIRRNGLGGLYKGLGVSAGKEAIHSFNYWIWHGLLFRHFTKYADTSRTPAGTRLMLSLAAKQLNWLTTVPFEVISSVNQLAADSPGFIAISLRIYREGGIGAFYRGLTLSMVLAINPAIMNTLITTFLRAAVLVKVFLGMDYEEARDHGSATIGLATAVSKLIATIATYPLIRAKVLQQTLGKPDPILMLLRGIVVEEGASGLYRGLPAMSYKTVLWNACMMVFKTVLGGRRPMTPPTTPPGEIQIGLTVPVMARDLPPINLITVEKLDEILSYLKTEEKTPQLSRVEALEARLDTVSGEIGEVKQLLQQIAAALPKSGSTGGPWDQASPKLAPGTPQR